MIFEPGSDLLKLYNNDQRKSPRAFVKFKDAVSCVINSIVSPILDRLTVLENAIGGETSVDLTGAHVSLVSGNYSNGAIPFNGTHDTNSNLPTVSGKAVIQKSGYYTLNTEYQTQYIYF